MEGEGLGEVDGRGWVRWMEGEGERIRWTEGIRWMEREGLGEVDGRGGVRWMPG